MRELSPAAIILGIVIGAALAAANAYVGLKVGMTISASIPAAVVSLLVMRVLLKRGSLLESNMVQTIGSAGESLTAGMIFVIPALFILGQAPSILEMTIWGALGGLLGVCFMVPLRRVLIVKEHDNLPFPEGVACAKVLESGERGGAGAIAVIRGAIVGAGFQLLTGLGFWPDKAVTPVPQSIKTQGALGAEPALLGVGYILGIRIAAYMMAGAALAWFVLIPGIAYVGQHLETPVFPEQDKLIGAMTPKDIHGAYIRYIGAGAVAIGGLLSLFKSFPTIVTSVWHVTTGVFGRKSGSGERADRDLPFILLVLITGGLGYAMWRVPQVHVGPWGAVAVLVFGFFFVTVSSRLVGLVGSSSNPASGMTIASLLGTALVFKFVFLRDGGAVDESGMMTLKVTCLSVGALVCIAICIAGDCSQDLKTGFLVRATPWKQQFGEMIGVLSAVVVIAGVILLLGNTYGFEATEAHRNPLEAPQARIMKILVDGVLGGDLPWVLIIMGGAAAIMVELLGLPALPFAVGLYLPLYLTMPIMVGGVVRWLVDRKRREHAEDDPGILTSSGLVAGMGLMGVAIAGAAALVSWGWNDPKWHNPLSEPSPPYVKVFDAPSEEPPPGAEPLPAPQPELVGVLPDGVVPPEWKTEGVMPHHLIPWLCSKIGFLPQRWGMTGAWWNGFAIFPFALMTIWLWWSARRPPKITIRPMGPPAAGPPGTMGITGGAPPAPTAPQPLAPTPASTGDRPAGPGSPPLTGGVAPTTPSPQGGGATGAPEPQDRSFEPPSPEFEPPSPPPSLDPGDALGDTPPDAYRVDDAEPTDDTAPDDPFAGPPTADTDDPSSDPFAQDDDAPQTPHAP